jgi:hypothetical protein
MKRKHAFLAGLILLLFGVVETQAGNRSGIVTAQFLKLPTSARATAIGNAQVALAEGPISLAYNPAGVL